MRSWLLISGATNHFSMNIFADPVPRLFNNQIWLLERQARKEEWFAERLMKSIAAPCFDLLAFFHHFVARAASSTIGRIVSSQLTAGLKSERR